MKRLKRSVDYKGKTVNVMLEFSTDAGCLEAQKEFENLLKKMYLDRMKFEPLERVRERGNGNRGGNQDE